MVISKLVTRVYFFIFEIIYFSVKYEFYIHLEGFLYIFLENNADFWFSGVCTLIFKNGSIYEKYTFSFMDFWYWIIIVIKIFDFVVWCLSNWRPHHKMVISKLVTRIYFFIFEVIYFSVKYKFYIHWEGFLYIFLENSVDFWFSGVCTLIL